MGQVIVLALQAVEALLPAIEKATPSSVSKVIAMLESAIPIAIGWGEDMVAPIENIITRLERTGAVTPDQVATLKAMMAADEADLDAAAEDDGLV